MGILITCSHATVPQTVIIYSQVHVQCSTPTLMHVYRPRSIVTPPQVELELVLNSFYITAQIGTEVIFKATSTQR